MADFTAGSASISIRPDLTGFHKKIKLTLRSERIEAPVNVVPEMGEFAEKLRTKLSKVNANVKVGIAPDMTGFATDLRTRLKGVSARMDVRINPNMSGFKTELRDRLAGMNNPKVSIPVDLDLTQAKLQLAAFRVEIAQAVRADFDLDITAALAKIAALRAAANGVGSSANLGSIGGAAGGMLNPIKLATMALGALAAVNLVPLIGQLAQAAGVISLLPAVAASAAAGIATIVIGSTGVMDAFKAGSKAADDAAKNGAKAAKEAAANAKAQASAQKAVASAARGVETAQDGVARAERGVQTAQKASERAQKDLTRARKDAKEQIEDLNLSLKGSALDERSAVLAVQRAEQRLRELGKDGTPVTTLDLSEAVLGVDEAKQRLDEVRERNGDLRDETEAANKAGIEGSEQVVSAKEKVAEADQGVVDAQKAVLDSQRDLVDAQQNLTDAQLAAAEATTASADAVDAYAEALANLSPNARQFVEDTRSLGTAWKDLRLQVQDNLFADLGTSLTNFANFALPTLKTGLSGIATEINSGLKTALADLSSESTKLDWTKILENTRLAIQPVMDGLSNLWGSLTNIAAIGSEFLPGFGDSFSNVMQEFRDWTESPDGQNKIRDFMQKSIDALKEIKDLFLAIGNVVGGLFSSSEENGKSMIQSMTDGLNKFADWMKTPEGIDRMEKFWDDAQQTAKDLLELVKQTIALADKFGKLTGSNYGLSKPSADGAGGKDENGQELGSHGQPVFGKWTVGGSVIFPGFDRDGWLGGLLGKSKTEYEDNNINEVPPMGGTVGIPSGGGRSAGRKVTRDEWIALFGDAEEFDRILAEQTAKQNQSLTDAESSYRDFAANVTNILDGLTAGGFTNFTNALDSLGKKIFGTTEDGKTDWGNMGTRFGEVVTNLVDTVFPGFQNGLQKAKDFAGAVVEGFNGDWSKLKGYAIGPVNWIIENVINGALKNAWNAVAAVIPGLKTWEGIAPIDIGQTNDGSGQGGFNKEIQHLATGGRVNGPGGPTDDKVPAMLSNGEYVVRAAAVRQIGVDNLDRLNNNPIKAKGKILGEGMFAGIRMAVGGSVDEAVDRAKNFMQGEHGKPYQYGGVGDPSWDCSGLWSGIVNVLSGVAATSGRLFNTESDFESMGWKPGLDGRVTIGIMRGGGGENSHMAGTIDGKNAESSGDNGVQWGGAARGSDNPMFGLHYTLQELAGKFASGGAGGNGGSFMDRARNAIASSISNLFEGPMNALGAQIPDFGPSLMGQLPRAAFDAVKTAAVSYLKSKIGGTTQGQAVDVNGYTPGSGPAVDQVKQAFAAYGWGKGPQWDATDWIVGKESGWNPTARNPSSGAYGLFQFLGSTKDQYLPDESPNPGIQGSAGAKYIKDRYGDPLAAKAFWETNGWYANGGVIPGYTPGTDKYQVGVSGGEAIMRPEWTRGVGKPYVDRMNYIARTQGVEGVQKAQMQGKFALGGVIDPNEFLRNRLGQFGSQVGDIAKSAIPEILGVQGTVLDPNHRYWQAAMDIQSAVQSSQAVTPGSNLQSIPAPLNGGPTPAPMPGTGNEFHFHVSDVESALQKTQLMLKQQQLAFTRR